MKGIHCMAGLLLLSIIRSSCQLPLHETEESSSLLREHSVFTQPKELTDVKRHSQGMFTNDYSKYLETQRAQDFVQWLMNNKRSGDQTKRHADGTYTSDVSSYLQEQALKDFVTWLKSGQTRRDIAEEQGDAEDYSKRHVDGSFTSELHKVLDRMAAKEYILWVMNSKPADASIPQPGRQ